MTDPKKEIEKNEEETPEQYLATCHKFKMENNRYYTDNNFYRGSLLTLKNGEMKDEGAMEILEDVLKYYKEKGDSFNLQRYYEKFGDKENSLRMAQKIGKEGTLLERVHSAQHIWKHFKDDAYKIKALEGLEDLISGYEKSGDNLLAAVYSDQLFRINGNENDRQRAINFHRQFAIERAEKGDSWWRAISLREIGKLSKGTEKQEEALKVGEIYANREVQRAEKVGNFKNAGLWARDIFKLSETPENRERAKKIFLKQVEKSQQSFEVSGKSSDLRTMAKSYWEMWKVTGEEEHRKKALEGYRDLLKMAKVENDDEQKKECYRVLLYITQ